MSHNTLLDRFNQTPEEDKTRFLLGLNRNWRFKLLGKLADRQIADALAYSDEDDAVACLSILSSGRRAAILKLLHEYKRQKLELLLSFAPQTAGRLIDSNFIEIKINAPKSEITRKVTDHYKQHNKPPAVIVEDRNGNTLGLLPLELLVMDDWKTPKSVKLKPLTIVPHTLDQERLIEKAAGTSAKLIAVVDAQNRTLGIVRTHDLLRVLEQEATEDFYRFAGLPPEEHIFDSPLRAVKLRATWLIFSLATSVMAAMVIALFENTIARLAILAAFMPIVAGLGGNAGTQTLAVMVRGIATGEIKSGDNPLARPGGKTALWVVLKELGAGLLNGVVTGTIVGIIAFVWQGNALLGVVLFVAMTANLLIAGLFGAVTPLLLKSLRIDPAIASAPIITTATDIIGFFVFLSLAARLLL